MPSPDEIASLQKSFGANLRRLRVGGKMTQQELAEAAELSLRSIQRIEAGQLNVLMTTVVRLRNALGCSADEILP